MVVNAYGEVNERATDDRAMGGGEGGEEEEVRGMPGQPDCGPARHHALTHEIFKISDTREGRQAQGSTNSNPSPSSSRRRRRRVSSPFASMRNFPTGLTCTLNNRRCSVRGRRRRSGIETHPCRE